MSETERPVPDQGREHESGAEAPTLREPQPGTEPAGAEPAAEAPPAQPTVEEQAPEQQAAMAAGPPPAPVVKRPARTMRMWVAAAAGAALLVGGGVGGFFIGLANHDHGRPGISRFGDRPDFRGGVPGPFRGGDGHRAPFYR